MYEACQLSEHYRMPFLPKRDSRVSSLFHLEFMEFFLHDLYVTKGLVQEGRIEWFGLFLEVKALE